MLILLPRIRFFVFFIALWTTVWSATSTTPIKCFAEDDGINNGLATCQNDKICKYELKNGRKSPKGCAEKPQGFKADTVYRKIQIVLSVI